MRILIIGASTRAIAESAVKDGYPVVTLDYFGDRDQKALVENYSLLHEFDRSFSVESLLQASHHLDYDSVVYISNVENYPNVIEDLGRSHSLLGNTQDVVRRVRDWRTLRRFCKEEEIPCPETLLAGEESQADPGEHWLCKPVRSGGGHDVRRWTGEPLSDTQALQAYVDGWPASMAFVADGRESVVIGLTEQLIGKEELGAKGFTWCGNILPLSPVITKETAVYEAVEEMAARLTRRFGLRGVNGVDFVVAKLSDGSLCPHLVEVNPRYTASMELIERAYGLNIFSLHLAGVNGEIPEFSLLGRLRCPFLGKGIVYAKKNVTIPETEGWMAQGRRDVPHPGELIVAGHPICTVFAEGDDRAMCLSNLIASADGVRREIGDEDGGLT